MPTYKTRYNDKIYITYIRPSDVIDKKKCIECNERLSAHRPVTDVNYSVKAKQRTSLINIDRELQEFKNPNPLILKKGVSYNLSGLCYASFIDTLEKTNDFKI